MRKFATIFRSGCAIACLTAFAYFQAPVDANAQFAADWEARNTIKHTDVDSLFASDWSGNSRTVIGGFDLDKDGKGEIILTDYVGHRVIVFEYDVENDVFEQVWVSPIDTLNHGVDNRRDNPRTVGIGDLDGDDKWEIVFPLGTTPPGWYFYEWDGVVGSDNYGTIYSSISRTAVDTCCAADSTGFDGRNERVTILDVDGDGKQELITMIRDRASGGGRGTLISSVEGDIAHNAGGTGFEVWSVEFFIDRGNYGGGSPYHSLPADLDGDGTLELVNHTWNNFNFYNIDVLGADSYAVAHPDSSTRFYKATPGDNVSLFGGDAADVDGDGDDEAYFPNFHTADLYVIDYKAGDDVLAIDASHVVNIGNVGSFYASIFDVDKNGLQNIFVGSGFGRTISSVELTGTDVRNPADYTVQVIYEGEQDVFRSFEISDSSGTVTRDTTRTGVFASKVQAHWNKNPIDFDNDGMYELLLSFQGNHDSTTTLTRTWNGTSWDTTVTKAVNEKSWAFMRVEFTGMGTGVATHDVTLITPDDYTLEQNYPNPFNPTTTIEYALPIKKEVSVKIYNMLGQVVRILVDKELQDAGNHAVTWDARDESGVRVASGTYMYTLEFGNFKKSRRMTLVK